MSNEVTIEIEHNGELIKAVSIDNFCAFQYEGENIIAQVEPYHPVCTVARYDIALAGIYMLSQEKTYRIGPEGNPLLTLDTVMKLAKLGSGLA